MNKIVKILVARNKKTEEILSCKILGGEDDGDRFISLSYDISLFSFEQMQIALQNWSQSTQEYAAGKFMIGTNFILEAEAWDLPSIGDLKVSIIDKEIFLD